ncbi:hypothetical protein IT415_03255 [bacterium]|nr:hypothetical protein [bacterium]
MVDFVTCIERWLDINLSHEALIAIPALFVALLVPIAFFLMERKDLYGFDKNVILDKIVLARVSIPMVFLVSIALLFNITTLSVLFTTLLLLVVMVVLIRVYKWMASVEILKYKTTYKQDMRLRFIRSIKNDIEKVDTWAIILNDEKLLEKNQRGLVAEFIAAVKNIKDSKNRYPKSNLLGLMSRNVSKVDFADIQSYDDLVQYSIEYFPEMRRVRTQRKQATNKTNQETYPPYQQKELAINLLKIALDKKISDIFDHIYFTAIKKYIAKDGVDEAGFIRDFLPAYVHVVKENEEYDAKKLWQELSDWVVTKELLSKEESRQKTISLLNAYMDSIGQRAHADTELPQHEVRVIDDVTERMLPNINVSFWFDIMTFYNSGWGLDEGEDSTHGQVRSHVSRRRDFGSFNALGDIDWSDNEEERLKAYEAEANRQDEETMYILGLIYPWLRNPKEIQKVLNQIQIIEKEKLFDTESHEARRLESLKNRFEKIRAYTDKMIAEQDSKKQSKKKKQK